MRADVLFPLSWQAFVVGFLRRKGRNGGKSKNEAEERPHCAMGKLQVRGEVRCTRDSESEMGKLVFLIPGMAAGD